MTPTDLLSLMRLLSAVESALLMAEKLMPECLYEELTRHTEILEREILAKTQPLPAPDLTDAAILRVWDEMPLLTDKRAMQVLFARKVLALRD